MQVTCRGVMCKRYHGLTTRQLLGGDPSGPCQDRVIWSARPGLTRLQSDFDQRRRPTRHRSNYRPVLCSPRLFIPRGDQIARPKLINRHPSHQGPGRKTLVDQHGPDRGATIRGQQPGQPLVPADRGDRGHHGRRVDLVRLGLDDAAPGGHLGVEPAELLDELVGQLLAVHQHQRPAEVGTALGRATHDDPLAGAGRVHDERPADALPLSLLRAVQGLDLVVPQFDHRATQTTAAHTGSERAMPVRIPRTGRVTSHPRCLPGPSR